MFGPSGQRRQAEASMSDHEIDIVAIPEQALVCLRERGPVSGLGERARRLSAILETAGITPVGPLQARFYDDPYDPQDSDFEVCLPMALDERGWAPDSIAEAAVSLTPAHHVMATTHRGPYSGIAGAHEAIAAELEAVGYTIAGPATETYVTGPGDGVAAGDFVTVVSRPYAR
jgi:effector-binding domain-containing protein